MARKPDGPTHNEVYRRNAQPTGPVKPPYRGAGATVKPATGSHVKQDGINKMIPITNNTKADGQYDKS